MECPGYDLGTVFNLSIIETAKIMIGLLKFVVIIGVALSWFYAFGANFYNSATSLIQEVYEQLYLYLEISSPKIGFDLTPLIAFFCISVSGKST